MKFEEVLVRNEFIKSSLQDIGRYRLVVVNSDYTEYETIVYTIDRIDIIKSFISFTGNALSEQHIVTKIKRGDVQSEVFDTVEEIEHDS